jgi:hypothetical protein
MRNSDIGWLAAVVLAALVGTAPSQAAAPPAGSLLTLEIGGPLNPLELLPAREWRSHRAPEKAGVSLHGPAEFSSPPAREFTIVVRIEDYSETTRFSESLTRSHGLCFPPSHTIRRDWRHTPEYEAKTVLDRLQEKLMELNQKKWFEVEFSQKEQDRTELRIRYTPYNTRNWCEWHESPSYDAGPEPFYFWPTVLPTEPTRSFSF